MGKKCGETGQLNKQGKPCGNPAGARTSHKGEGRCYKHGGASNGAPLKHGRYVKPSTTGSLADKIQTHLQDADPLNLTPELALLRSLLDHFQEKLEEAGADPTRTDAGTFLLLVQGIQKVADTISKIQTREMLTAREGEYLLVTLADILKGWDGKVFDAKAATRELQRRAQLPGLTTIEVITEG